jgi:hypothetical protein
VRVPAIVQVRREPLKLFSKRTCAKAGENVTTTKAEVEHVWLSCDEKKEPRAIQIMRSRRCSTAAQKIVEVRVGTV